MQKLFSLTVSKSAESVKSVSFKKEEELHRIVSGNLMTFFGASLLDDEWKVGDSRIDTIGITQKNCPIIIEYKKGKDYNVVNQVLSYYHDLTDHGSDFRWLVTQRLGKEKAEKIKLNNVRLVCVAREFAKFDLKSWRSHKKVELVTYRYFDNNTLLFQWEAGKPGAHEETPQIVVPKPQHEQPTKPSPGKKGGMSKAVEKSDPLRQQVFNSLCSAIMQIAPTGIERFEMKHYFVFKKSGKPFIFIRAFPQRKIICFALNLDPSNEKLDGKLVQKGNIGHLGRIRVEIETEKDLKQVFHLVEKAYRIR